MLARFARHVFLVTAISVGLMIAVGFIVSNVDAYESFFALVFIAGTAGGIANNFRHTRKVEGTAEPDESEARLVIYQIYLSPLVGGVFGVACYGIFAAGLLQGDAFPAFDGSSEFKGAASFADAMVPVTNADGAKALLWAFIAGFAEWFVPNFIDRFAKGAADPGRNRVAKPAEDGGEG
ncbi:MAG: hypothetical protein R3F11_00650 [Verrucomicrobiales bacterium]